MTKLICIFIGTISHCFGFIDFVDNFLLSFLNHLGRNQHKQYGFAVDCISAEAINGCTRVAHSLHHQKVRWKIGALLILIFFFFWNLRCKSIWQQPSLSPAAAWPERAISIGTCHFNGNSSHAEYFFFRSKLIKFVDRSAANDRKDDTIDIKMTLPKCPPAKWEKVISKIEWRIELIIYRHSLYGFWEVSFQSNTNRIEEVSVQSIFVFLYRRTNHCLAMREQ